MRRGRALDPGKVPPVNSIPFVGELRCIEVDPSGAPLSGNHLKGEATIVSSDGDASKYNAVGLLGEPFTNNGDEILCLGGGVSDECPSGAEYEGCAETPDAQPLRRGRRQPAVRADVRRSHTELTLVPCRADFERQSPTRVIVQFLAFNEFEQLFSASTHGRLLEELLPRRRAQHLLDPTRPRRASSSPTCDVGPRRTPASSASSEEYHRLDDQQTRAAFNLHEQGTRPLTDLIFLPEGP